MNYREFGDAYRGNLRTATVAYPGSDNHFDMELVNEFYTARTWNERLGNIVLNHISGGEKDERFESDTIDEYVEWATQWAPNMLYRVIERSKNSGVSSRYITDLTFHLAAPAFAPQWHALSDETLRVGWAQNRATQTRLALASAKTMALRKELKEERQSLTEDQRRIYGNIRSEFVGQSTEIDVDLACVEVVTLFPETHKVAVPAPRLFEQSHRSLNIDTLILDTENRDAHGIQAKTRLNARDYKITYDKRYVTLVEGFGDLGNKSFETTRNRLVAVSDPGLLSLRHISRTPFVHIPLGQDFSHADREALKQTAKKLTAGSHYTVERAGRIIGERLFGPAVLHAVSQH